MINASQQKTPVVSNRPSKRRTASVPLSLYVHVPWCVRKCPYCDFNSHQLRGELPERAYVEALLADLDHDLPEVGERRVESIFIGGGTPSLLSAEALGRLLDGLRRRLRLRPDAEITLEANPGTVEQGRFHEFRQAGVNRLSIGVQSFNANHLQRLGRIHGPQQAIRAAEAAHAAGFANFNLDLMFGLPGQSPAQALADVDTAIALAPAHLSHYQLTLEPGTLFYKHPPPLPDDEATWAMLERGQERLSQAGYGQYEVSAYARPGRRCRHNLNYWRFGDYLGIGAGAHGKLSDANGAIMRLWKLKSPRDYLRHAGTRQAIGGREMIPAAQLGLEFMLNALRLTDGFAARLFRARTGLPLSHLQPALAEAEARGLLECRSRIRPTELGRQFLNDLLELFVPE